MRARAASSAAAALSQGEVLRTAGGLLPAGLCAPAVWAGVFARGRCAWGGFLPVHQSVAQCPAVLHSPVDTAFQSTTQQIKSPDLMIWTFLF